jgi:DNA-binding NarL/FixJ family response regulator
VETIEINNRYQLKTGEKTKRAMRARLTSKERQILYYVAKGNTNKQIAQRLKIREQTVKNRMSTILLKLNAIDRVHAIFVAIRSGLI